MELLKPERTFAEKLLALHVDMSRGVEGARNVRTRHYHDISQLIERSPDVQRSIEHGEFRELGRQAAEVSNANFGTAIDVDTLDLSESPALAPTPDQVRVLRANYENPLEQALYYRTRIPFDEILERVALLRERLAYP